MSAEEWNIGSKVETHKEELEDDEDGGMYEIMQEIHKEVNSINN